MWQGLIKVNKKLFLLLLTCLVIFLIFPKISLAENFEDITQEEIEKYLSLPSDKVENLIRSLIDLFNSEWINQISSGYSTAEESAVPNIMRGVVRVQALNYLLIDVPVEVTFGIVKNGVKIAKIFLGDISELLDQLEKESVKRATEYGMKALLQKEIRMSPGAIGFKYTTQKGETKEVVLQYIMIYQPVDAKSGKLVIRFYSPNYLEIPKNKGNITGTIGIYTELEHDLPPFIVDIQGIVKDYEWVGTPSMKIDFPPEVPDLGIKPLSLWEKQIWKPIVTQIKEVEVIITKSTGKSPKILEKISKIAQVVDAAKDFWEKIKSNSFPKIVSFLTLS